MKVSMSNEIHGLKVSLSVQLPDGGSAPEALIPLFVARGGYSEDEALDDLRETLLNSLPHTLFEADATLRIAIEERLVSIYADARSLRENSRAISDKSQRLEDATSDETSS